MAAPVSERNPRKGEGGRPRVIQNPVTDLGFCYCCTKLVKKGTAWTLKVRNFASRLYCERCK